MGRFRRSATASGGQISQRATNPNRMGYYFRFAALMVAGLIQRSQLHTIHYLLEENRVLRQQLGTQRIIFTDAQRCRLARAAHKLMRAVLDALNPIVTPDTLMRWYRQLVATKYDGTSRRKPGRPPIPASVEQAILDLAKDNPGWGYTRLKGALSNLGHSVARATIARVLSDHGLDPAPKRTLPWSTFLKLHWGSIAATDFFSVEVLTRAGLVRYFVLFAIDLKTRRVQIANICHQPYGQLLEQIARNWTDPVDGFLKNMRYLIHDRDPVFTGRFASILRTAGVKTAKLTAHSPNLNAFAERFVGSIRRECLDHVIPLGVAHLRNVVSEYVEHYNLERNHQGLDNQLLTPCSLPANTNGAIQRKQRLGGLLNYYYRGAA